MGLWWSSSEFLQWRGSSKTQEKSLQKEAQGFESREEGSSSTGTNHLINARRAPAKFSTAFYYIQCFNM